MVDLAPLDFTDAKEHRRKIAQAVNQALVPTATGSTTPRSLADRAADTANVLDHTADATGVLTSDTAFTNAVAAGKHVEAPAGTYNLAVSVVPALADSRISIDPQTDFSSATFDLSNLTRAIGAGPNIASELIFKDVDTAFDSYEHVIGQSIFMQGNTIGAKTVGLYANAEVAIAGHSAFGANIGTFVTAAGTGVALEIDSHLTHASGIATALAVDAVGAFPSEVAIVIQPNSATAWFKTGISFNNSGDQVVSGSCIRFNLGTAARFIEASSGTFTTAEIELPSLIVGPTVVGATGNIRIDASAADTPLLSVVGSGTNIALHIKTKGTGSHDFFTASLERRFRLTGSGADYIQASPGTGGTTLSTQGGSTNSSLNIKGKGTGSVRLRDSADANKIEINSTGIGFYATAPIAKPTVTGSAAANAALQSLLTQLSNLGLIIDSST